MGKRYKLEHISDIFLIPKDKFDGFLVDFRAYYETGNDMAELLTATGQALKTPIEVIKGGMTWIDDDRHDINIKIATHSKEASTKGIKKEVESDE